MKIIVELRPCKVGDRKALFHKWSERTGILEPSPMIGGHQGGVLKYTVGIVEFENGKVGERFPNEIKFTDYKIKNYYFDKDE